MDKAQKRELVTALNEVFSDTGVIVVAHDSGLSVSEMTDFRSRAREAGARVKSIDAMTRGLEGKVVCIQDEANRTVERVRCEARDKEIWLEEAIANLKSEAEEQL